MSDKIIWLILLFVFLIIIGLYISEYTPLDLTEKQKILKLNYITENFSPSVSSTNDQTIGASQYYKWGLPNDHHNNKCNHTCNHSCPSICPLRCPPPIEIPVPVEINNCVPPPKDVNLNEVCKKCDITLNNDIDKYVLKSSVPACPDMSDFVTKNMMNANPDLSDYILKSEVKPCEKVDISQYILKSEIPACPTCPVCPECPICPVCPPIPPQKQCKKIYEYKITEHPDINKYISKEDLDKYYIKKSDILNSDIVKDYLNKNCKGSNTASNTVQKPVQKPVQTPVQTPVQKPVQTPVPNNSSELLRNDISGYYAGDSLYAGV